MDVESTEENAEKLRKRLRSYVRAQMMFHEPHFTNAMIFRDGDREQVINMLLNPEKLVYVYSQPGKYGDTTYCLHFEMGKMKTLLLPVIFDAWSRKCIYLKTYIMKHTSWQKIAERRRQNEEKGIL